MPQDDDLTTWRAKVDRRLQLGDDRFTKIEKDAGRRHAEILGAIEGAALRRKATDLKRYGDEDDDDISNVTDVKELQRKARRQREKAKQANKFKTWGKVAAPFFGGICIGIWEMVKHWVLK